MYNIVYCYVIAIVFIWEPLNGTTALLCCHVSMKLDLTKCMVSLITYNTSR